MSKINLPLMGTKKSEPLCQSVPKSVYVKIYASTLRYHQLMKIAKKRNCSWHTIALEAIDYYLANPPRGKAV